MSDSIYLLTISLFLGTILTVFGMKYFSAAHQARARVAGADAYRALAEKTAATHAECTTLLASTQTELSRIDARLATIEKILKEVE